MYKVLLVFIALFAIILAANIPPKYLLDDQIPLTPKNEIATRGIFLSSQGKKAVENFVEQFKDGYKNDKITFSLKKSFIEIDVNIDNFTILGIDNMEIKKLDIGYTLSQSVKFNFLFPNVTITGKVLTDSFIDALSNYGLRLTSNVETDVELILENIIFQGYFKYKMPILFGSIKIYKFNASILVGNVISQIDGLLGNGKLNKVLNIAVEEALLRVVNSNEDKISSMLERTLVPWVNSKLDGSNIWTIIG